MKECKIIRDLFPSYIDGLTNEETNQYIEEHLNNCEDCKKVLEEMRKELKLDTTKKDSKEVKYIKKFNNKMKLLKMILLGILIIFLLSYARKMLILINLNNKVSEYESSTNYYIKSVNFGGRTETITVLENYKKEDKYIRKLKSISETSKLISTDYFNGESVNSYSEVEFMAKEEYVARKNTKLNDYDSIFEPQFPNVINISHPLNFIAKPLFSTITSESCNGKDCYRIAFYAFGDRDATIYYFEKETGLLLRSLGESIYADADADGELHDMVTDYQYEFDMVTEEDFIEPDISEYEVEE